MDDQAGQSGVGDIVEDSGQCVESEDENEGTEEACQGSADAGLGQDGRGAKRAGADVSSHERTENIGGPLGQDLLRRNDGIVEDAAERLGDGNVLDDENDHDCRHLRNDVRNELRVRSRDSGLAEASFYRADQPELSSRLVVEGRRRDIHVDEVGNDGVQDHGKCLPKGTDGGPHALSP